ncbi:MAG: recombinase family protein [Firmicutes bacterium]|nr:recombinase family protein [Bacillota bacterium]
MPTPLLYCRVSTQEQANEGYSLDAQLAQLEAYCGSQGWEPGGRYVEEGYSAKNLERPQLQALLADVRSHRFKEPLVLVWRLDRLTRSVADLYVLLSMLEEDGGAFRSITEPFETQTAVGKLFVTLIAAMAQWERENLIERVRLGQMHQVIHTDDWTGGRPPYGYRLVKKKLRVDPEAAAVVREVYGRFLVEGNLYAIARDLNARGIPAPGGKGWNAHRLRYILSNPVYAGIRTWQRHVRGADGKRAYRRRSRDSWKVVEDQRFPAIVDRGTWERAMGVVEGRGRVSHRHGWGEHPLTGVLVCGACGSTMNGKLVRRGDRSYRYYRCPRRYQGRACQRGQVRAEDLEGLVLTAIQARFAEQALLEQAVVEMQGADDTDGSRLAAELEDVRRRMRRWEDAYEEAQIDASTLGQRLRDLRAREGEILVRMRNLSTAHEGPAQVFASEGWASMTAAERQAFVHDLVARVTIDLDGSVDIDWR